MACALVIYAGLVLCVLAAMAIITEQAAPVLLWMPCCMVLLLRIFDGSRKGIGKCILFSLILMFIAVFVRYDFTNGIVLYNTQKHIWRQAGYVAVVRAPEERVARGLARILKIRDENGDNNWRSIALRQDNYHWNIYYGGTIKFIDFERQLERLAPDIQPGWFSYEGSLEIDSIMTSLVRELPADTLANKEAFNKEIAGCYHLKFGIKVEPDISIYRLEKKLKEWK
jgi:hypothetical protein